MKVVILAGGLGTRLAEETEIRPKPMVDIGGRPILWHILKHFSHHGFNEFFIALGYKGEVIKRYFLEYRLLGSHLTVDLASGAATSHGGDIEPWKLHLIDTGLATQTGGRLRRLQRFLGPEPFMVTYGDGVSNVDISALLSCHRQHGRVGTVTAVRPPARFGGISAEGDKVLSFAEKPQSGEGWINGGYMVLEPQVFSYLEGDGSVLETDGLERLAKAGQLGVHRHFDFWQCMDTLREKSSSKACGQKGGRHGRSGPDASFGPCSRPEDMIFQPLRLQGAHIVEIERLTDHRGFFARTFCAKEFEGRGLDPRVAQCNLSFSERAGTIRGMHLQATPHEEAKLVTCLTGAIYDVIIDMRPRSPTYRHWEEVELSQGAGRSLYVPAGFAHGFQTLEPGTVVAYQMSEFFEPTAARGYRWDDPAFGIRWPLPDPIVSDRDRSFPLVQQGEF